MGWFRKKKHFNLGLHDIGEDELQYWKILDVQNPELGSLAIRIRTEKPPLPDIDDYKTAIEITWDYSELSEGFPDEVTQNNLDTFDDRLEELQWYNNLSFSVKRTTGLGQCIIVFYTKSYDEFMDLFNKYLEGVPPLPIKIEYFKDKDWKLWSEGVEDYIQL